ncbi:MAG: hypothetical protein ACFFFT_08290 [Candidatus Thorarchaeota archaeon]
MFSGFFVCIIISLIINIIYALFEPNPTNEIIISILNFVANFFTCFGTVFILIVHRMILQSTIVFSVKQQYRYILLYGLLLFFGMLILVLLGGIFKDLRVLDKNYLGVEIDLDIESPHFGNPKWSPIFYIYVISILSALSIIPIFRTSFKIYHSLETKVLKRKWFFYLLGSIGLVSVLYMNFTDLLISFLLPNMIEFTIIYSIYGISVILWGYLMYYGIGFKLKE